MVKFSKIILLFFFACIGAHSFSQDINYTFHTYTLKDGLAGNNVYCATQDKEGFIWFGTETGLSRFDGTHFKNYTVADGLPDNEIINIFTDSKGRIWLIPFRKSLSYIYKRKIYNSTNDSILKNIRIIGNCYNIIEDNDHRIIIHDTKGIHIVGVNGEIKTINVETLGKNIQFINIYRTASGKIYVLTRRDVFKLEGYNLSKIFTLDEKFAVPFYTLSQILTDSSIFIQNSMPLVSGNNAKVVELFFNSKMIKFYETPVITVMFEKVGNRFYTTSSRGINFIYINNPQLNDSIIIDKSVNRLFIDAENNNYLLSRNAGIYVKNNAEIKHKNFSNNNINNLGVDYLSGNINTLFIGATNNNPIIVDKNNFRDNLYMSRIISAGISYFGGGLSTICFMNEVGNKENIVANVNGVYHTEKKVWKCYNDRVSIKYVQEIENKYLLGTVDKLIIANKLDFKIIDTIWHERTTFANFIDSNYYIGTINGLYKLSTNKVSTYLGASIPIFQRRISSIKKGLDGVIWVGTYDAGVVAYKNGKILQIFNDSSGLTSNICRNIFINGNYLWVGTDKGLNKIDISKPPYKIIINYTTSDGLASNMINAVYTDSNMVYVGTPEGLTFFDEAKIVNDSKCDMRILGITVSGKEKQWDSSKIILKHIDNNIRFDFVGLSFKSAGDIMYSYRLIGLDGNEWKTIRENYLEYPTLPSGNYTFEIYATNKFGVKSSTVKISVEIEKKLFEKLWFRLLLLLLSFGLIYFFFNKRINKIKDRVREKEIINRKLNEMEQMALRSQMNPHFIFNCLNSIQDYVINSDVQGANKFITDFSRLIRSTLDNSSKKVISIEDEIKYLTNYLTIEQYRFENKFTFNIYKDESINLYDNYIPPMLLQPYIENAIRHGINNKKEGVGLIEINILKKQHKLICEIIDNGIGRKAAMELKGNTAIEYQSKGMELTAKRIQLLNKNIEEDIVIKIEDVKPPKMGTKVTISLPMQ
jgi:Histidine kinase/Y_Y_Y domain/Two component regulator propeller